MRICMINDGRLSGIADRIAGEVDAVCISSIGSVCYEEEIDGKTGRFRGVAQLSRTIGCLVLCGCETDAKGMKRKSVIAADRGKILGISDMTHVVDRAYQSGFGLRAYDTKAGKLGVLVGEDLYFPETAKLFSEIGCDLIVSLVLRAEEGVLLSRACSFCFGVPIVWLGRGYAAFCVSGRVALASPLSPLYAELSGKKEFHLVERRQSGFSH